MRRTNYKWGNSSLKVRAELHPKLQRICDELLQYMDVSLVSGHRGKEVQNEHFREGRSKLQYPQSKHNQYPSIAVDVQPHPYPQKETELHAALGFMAGLATVIAVKYGIELRWGGDWDMDGDVTDNDFDDLFHLEIVE